MVAATWNTAGGNWFTAANWDEPNPNPPPATLHFVPGASEDVSIPDNSLIGTPFTITYNGASTINTLNAAANATLDIAGGTLTLANGGALSSSRIDVDAGAALTVGAGTLVATAGTIAGTIGGGGGYVFTFGTFNINAGAAITVASWTLGVTSNGTTSLTELNTNLSYGGAFTLADFSGNHARLDTNGNTLTFSGTANIDGTILGAGKVLVTGTSVLGSTGNGAPVVTGGAMLEYGSGGSGTQHLNLTLGDATTSGTLKIAYGAVYSIDETASILAGTAANAIVDNAGQFRVIGSDTHATVNAAVTNAVSGTITIGNGNSLLLGGGATHMIDGTVAGLGTLIVGAGTTSLNNRDVKVAHIHLAGGNGGATMRLGSDIAYEGELAFTGQFDTIDLNGKTLNLVTSGSTLFGNTLKGGGTLKVSGLVSIGNNLNAATATPLTIDNGGSLSQTGALSLNGTLKNNNGQTYTLTGISQIVDFGAVILNNGTFSDIAAGQSIVSADFANFATGTLSVAAGARLVLNSGTQNLGGTLSGDGTLTMGFAANATINTTLVSVANLTLAGGNGGARLSLGNNVVYAGALEFENQFDTIALSGRVLTLSGTGSSLLGNTIDGGGASRLKITGSATLGGNVQIGQTGSVLIENAGTVNQNGALTLFGSIVTNAGRTWSIAAAGNLNQVNGATFTNNGAFLDNAAGETSILASFTNNGAITIGTGATARFAGPANVLNGAINGAGTLFLGGGANTLNANVGTSFWHVGGGGTVTLARNIAYAGNFLLDNPFTVLALDGHSLAFTGPAAFGAGIVAGNAALADTLTVSGPTVDLSALQFSNWTSGQDTVALNGTAGNDTLTGSVRDDILTGGVGNDIYVNPGAGDTIVEGAAGGTDTVSSAVTFSIEAIANVERLFLTGTAAIDATGNTLNNQFIGNDTINTINGKDGNDTINAGGGADTVNGGGGSDRLIGGLQRDKIIPGADNARDEIVFTLIGESTGFTRDVITGLDLNAEDKIDLPGAVSGIAAARSGTLSLATFNANLTSVLNAAALPINNAVLFTPTSGDLVNPNMVYLVVDANGIAGYQANQDWVFQLENHTGILDTTDFI